MLHYRTIKITGISLLILFFGLVNFQTAKAQTQRERDDRATISGFKGIQYTAPDSIFYANFRFRMQNRLKYTSLSGNDFGVDNFEARIRRLRLRMDGYIYNPKLTYSIQLAFTRGDQDFDDTGIPNIVRDAVVFYNFNKNFYVAFGQNKLPGNRQRVNSSGQLQFADRSLVNSTFNIDRDFGIKAYYTLNAEKAPIHLKGAITTGEGRSVNTTDGGLAYTGRVEFLPLGKFTNDGDYSEGDLEREKKPKISIGGGYSYNHNTTKTAGQTGKLLYSPLTLKTMFFDAMFKYAGWAYQAEYMQRDTDNPITTDTGGDVRYAYKGRGLNQQLSYLIGDEGYEIAGRYTMIKPHSDISAFEKQTEVAELGLTKYFRAHRLKMQLNVNYLTKNGIYDTSHQGNNWGSTFQIELGI